jgi:hypothetical protein
MTTPRSLRELITFLGEHRVLHAECEIPNQPRHETLLFDRVADGGLWFKTHAGGSRYVPIDCGKAASETGVRFFAWGFELEKFGVTITYRYGVEKGG